MSPHQPNDFEVREKIEAIKDDKYRHAFMFQLITCARISEVCGKYAPTRHDFEEIEFNEELGVLFIVKTAKRKGRLRPCAVPLNPLYEPWTQPLLDYFKDCKDEYPFKFHENPAHSVRYMQWVAEEAFDGMEWPMHEYTRSLEASYTQDMVLDKRYGKTGFDEYLVELEDGARYWTYDKEVVKQPEKIEERWKPFRSHALRKRRSLTLTLDYEFDGFDIAYYGGWTETGKDSDIPGALKYYLHMDLSSAGEVMVVLKKMAKRYFKKLCITV